MKFTIKYMSLVFMTGVFSSVYSMMQEENTIDGISSRIKNLDITGYKNLGTSNEQNDYFEKSWNENMDTINALVNDKDFSGLKPLFSKVRRFGNAVLYAASLMKNFDLMKDKIKTIDTIKKDQSEMKRFLIGQKIESAFSFGKKQEQYKELKQLLMDIVDILNGKIETMKKEIEIKKK